MGRRQKYVRITRDYAEFLINSLTMLNGATEEQVFAFCLRSKQEAMQNLIAGFQTTIDEKPVEASKPGADQSICMTCQRPYLMCQCDTGNK